MINKCNAYSSSSLNSILTGIAPEPLMDTVEQSGLCLDGSLESKDMVLKYNDSVLSLGSRIGSFNISYTVMAEVTDT